MQTAASSILMQCIIDAVSGREQGLQGRQEEQVQREREVGREEITGERMPRGTYRLVRDGQVEEGMVWQMEEVQPGGLADRGDRSGQWQEWQG